MKKIRRMVLNIELTTIKFPFESAYTDQKEGINEAYQFRDRRHCQ